MAALVIARHGSPAQRDLLRQVIAGEMLLSFAVQGRDGVWTETPKGLTGRRDGGTVVLDGERSFVDNFRIAHKFLVLFELDGKPCAVLIDTTLAGIERVDLVTTAKDAQSLVKFNGVRVAERDIVPLRSRWREDKAFQFGMIAAALFYVAALVAGLVFAMVHAEERRAPGRPAASAKAAPKK